MTHLEIKTVFKIDADERGGRIKSAVAWCNITQDLGKEQQVKCNKSGTLYSRRTEFTSNSPCTC